MGGGHGKVVQAEAQAVTELAHISFTHSAAVMATVAIHLQLQSMQAVAVHACLVSTAVQTKENDSENRSGCCSGPLPLSACCLPPAWHAAQLPASNT